jgi:hypothetical protein
MRHLWRHILALIAVVTGGALAVMNVLGSFGAFADPRIAYGAQVSRSSPILASSP